MNLFGLIGFSLKQNLAFSLHNKSDVSKMTLDTVIHKHFGANVNSSGIFIILISNPFWTSFASSSIDIAWV